MRVLHMINPQYAIDLLNTVYHHLHFDKPSTPILMSSFIGGPFIVFTVCFVVHISTRVHCKYRSPHFGGKNSDRITCPTSFSIPCININAPIWRENQWSHLFAVHWSRCVICKQCVAWQYRLSSKKPIQIHDSLQHSDRELQVCTIWNSRHVSLKARIFMVYAIELLYYTITPVSSRLWCSTKQHKSQQRQHTLMGMSCKLRPDLCTGCPLYNVHANFLRYTKFVLDHTYFYKIGVFELYEFGVSYEAYWM